MKAINRVLLAFKEWEDRKQEMQPLLKGADERTLLQLHLQHLSEANHRLLNTIRPDERPFMVLLQNHIAKLEKQLYPNWLQRQFYHLKDRWIDGPAYLKQREQQRNTNMEALKEQLKEIGFYGIHHKLEEHLDADLKIATIPLTCQLDQDKRLEFKLYFEKNAQGNFELPGFHATLSYQDEIQKAQHFDLNDWPGLRTNQTLSLLEGRALKQIFTNAEGRERQRWVELGVSGIQHYDPKHDFDVKALVESMPNLKGSKPEMINYIENGQAAPAIWRVGKNFQWINIQADPANRGLKFLDDKNRPITIDKLTQNVQRQGPGVKTFGEQRKTTRKEVKNGQRI